MENSNQPLTHPSPLGSQGYNHQVWNGNKVYANQNVNTDHYSQHRNHFYQASYSSSNLNEINCYLSSSSKDSSQYPHYPSSNYPMNTTYAFQVKNYSTSPYGENVYVSQENSYLEANQVSSIPTPPETSLTGDDTAAFVQPGSNHLRNLQPPANLDEGSQASSASSLPDEPKSKPNFSYPPTPNTLSSPGAASMSSFHDDLECISSPGWPKTPASPVANTNYEFANIKRPENLLKLYTLSDEADRRYFLDKLIVFNEERGSPITQCPTISKQPLDVFKVYLTVKERGGFLEVTNGKRWKDIAGAIGVGASSSAAYTLRKQYMKVLLPFECKFDRGGIDPQPIINMVEASSRKKAKNTPTAYGSCNPSYSQAHSNYPSYQSSRYPMEYPCSLNYQQSNQYNEYSSNSGYYQGTTYNPSCRYVNKSNSQGYYDVSQNTYSGNYNVQTYQQSASDITLNKIPDTNYYSSSQVNSYSNPKQCSFNPYPNQKFQFQAKQVQSSESGQIQNQCYRTSEGPQVDSFGVSADNPKIGLKVAASNSSPKTTTTPNTHYSSRPQKTWPVDQYQSSIPDSPKSHFTSPPAKPNLGSNTPETQPDKPQNLASVPPKNPLLPTKSQLPATRVSQMVKRPLEFPSNTVEAVKAVAARRRRCPARRLGTVDPWRLMLALKSGLLAESTWALDTLCILLADNNTVVYFALTHLPGLLNVLVDHYRCFLNKIFHLANDVEIEAKKDFSHLSLNEIAELENKVQLLDTPNYTYKTRCKKKVEIQYDEALFLIDPERSWDKYEGFDVLPEHWQKGGGDITTHILTTFDTISEKVKFCREEKSKSKVNGEKSLRPVRSFIGEPVVVLQKLNFLVNKISDAEDNDSSIKKKVESVQDKRKLEELNGDVEGLRGSASSRKRFLCQNLDDEAYCFDEPALCGMSDSQEMLSRRCVCVASILRNLSFVPGNDLIMAQNSGVLLLLGRLLLFHHEHKATKNAYHKYEKEIESWDESCISLKEDPEWWWPTVSVLRDHTLVILSNLSGQLDLAPFPEEVSLPILDGLLHWVVCPSSYAQDPLPSPSVLSPQRLSLEALCKLSVLSSNVDLILAMPPWSRIENLFAFLIKSLCQGQDQIVREFALILLSNISEADSVAARTIAEQSHSLSYLIAFIEEAEANAFQIALSQGTKKLRDKPELMGTTPGMVKRAASTLKNLALVGENRSLFGRHQARLLSLVMSQVMDQEVATVIADVLFYSSLDPLPIS